jgi:Pyruvate/2-oxoacid:ferredoxin oxidoreductase delta subunit
LLLTVNRAVVAGESGIEAGDVIEELPVDGLVVAVGQQAAEDESFKHERLLRGGDLVSGPATVVEAMASGKAAALQILRRCGLAEAKSEAVEDGLTTGETEKNIAVFDDLHLEYYRPQKAVVPVEERAADRRLSFVEVVPPLDEAEALAEAGRCFNCGSCNGCGICWFFCPDLAIALVEEEDGTTVVIDEDHCKGCGLCAVSCPRAVIEMQEDM